MSAALVIGAYILAGLVGVFLARWLGVFDPDGNYAADEMSNGMAAFGMLVAWPVMLLGAVTLGAIWLIGKAVSR